ncbi:MAG: glutaredoxin domain-containing protein, partial [Rhodospirillales bacterium]|nr:glutaredoxin domain-containing protein [Rhodospirillales bacterium]
MSQLEGAGTPENLALPLKLYWQPGCSSCLKMKEFVLDHGVRFESVNVLEDDAGFAELQELGVRMVPIAARGTVWANGAVFRDVAAVAGHGRRDVARVQQYDGYFTRPQVHGERAARGVEGRLAHAVGV